MLLFHSLWSGLGGTSKTDDYDDLESLDVELKAQNARMGGFEDKVGSSGKVGGTDDAPAPATRRQDIEETRDARSSVPYAGPLEDHGITKTVSLDVR